MGRLEGISSVFTEPGKRVFVSRILLVGWGLLNIPLGVVTGIGALLPRGLPELQFQVSVVYEHMLSAIYITLGIAAILAAADPVRHKLLILFIILSSFAHAGIMLADAYTTSLQVWDGLTWGSAVLLGTAVAFLVFYPMGVPEAASPIRARPPGQNNI
ncbi:MAG: DUF6632 domain-containing protein [Thermoplasmata archaeon]